MREPSAVTDMRLVILFLLISSFAKLLDLRVMAVSQKNVVFEGGQFIMMLHPVSFGLKIKFLLVPMRR
jgi:hypothetical protein